MPELTPAELAEGLRLHEQHSTSVRDCTKWQNWLIDHGETALRELTALREQVAWRPIDEAPKDGTPVLLWDGNDMVATGFDPNYQEWANDGGYEINPTHWQPLPEPPKEQV